LESHNIEKTPHPPFSPEIAPSDFYLFGYLKQTMAGQQYENPDQLYLAVDEILSEIPKDTLIGVFQTWERRSMEVIRSNGEYIR